jgi:hypothetical protein
LASQLHPLSQGILQQANQFEVWYQFFLQLWSSSLWLTCIMVLVTQLSAVLRDLSRVTCYSSFGLCFHFSQPSQSGRSYYATGFQHTCQYYNSSKLVSHSLSFFLLVNLDSK